MCIMNIFQKYENPSTLILFAQDSSLTLNREFGAVISLNLISSETASEVSEEP